MTIKSLLHRLGFHRYPRPVTRPAEGVPLQTRVIMAIRRWLRIEGDINAIAGHSAENRELIAGLRRDLESHGKLVQGHGRQIGKLTFRKHGGDDVA